MSYAHEVAKVVGHVAAVYLRSGDSPSNAASRPNPWEWRGLLPVPIAHKCCSPCYRRLPFSATAV